MGRDKLAMNMFKKKQEASKHLISHLLYCSYHTTLPQPPTKPTTTAPRDLELEKLTMKQKGLVREPI